MTTDEIKLDAEEIKAPAQQEWEPMEMTIEGNIVDLVQKNSKSSAASDSGDPGKPPGQG